LPGLELGDQYADDQGRLETFPHADQEVREQRISRVDVRKRRGGRTEGYLGHPN